VSDATPRATTAQALQSALKWFVGGVVIAALWTFAGDHGDAAFTVFGERVVQFSFIALTLGAQRISLLHGIVAGVVLAFVAVAMFEGDMASFALIGKLFLKALKMIVVPLIAFAVISAMTSLGDVRNIGRIGSRTVLYYFFTTAVAVTLGSVLVNLMEPGVGLEIGNTIPDKVANKTELGLSDILFGFLHDNIFGAFADAKMLPIILFCIVFGAVLTTLGDRGKPVIAVCDGANDAMMKIVELVLLLAPIGVYGLVAGRFGEALATGNFWRELEAVRDYSITVLVGLGLHAFVVIPILLKVTTGRSPAAYVRGMATALMTAFSTASSAATIPLTMEAAIDNNGVDERSAKFVIPLGATVNMDGTALYEAVAVIFIAQAAGVELTLTQQLIVIITATLAAIGAAGIPQAGLVTMVIVLQAVNLPLAGVELILAVDWLLDRFRTVVNVWGDSVGAAVVEPYARALPDEQTAT